MTISISPETISAAQAEAIDQDIEDFLLRNISEQTLAGLSKVRRIRDIYSEDEVNV